MRIAPILSLALAWTACARVSTPSAPPEPAAPPIPDVAPAEPSSPASPETPPPAAPPPEPRDVVAVRAWAAAHPDDAPAVLHIPGAHLVLLRRPHDATVCLVTDPADDGPARDPRCFLVDAPFTDPRLLRRGRQAWLAAAGSLLVLREDGSVRVDARVPQGPWFNAGGGRAPAPRRLRARAPTIAETSPDDLPLDALIALAPTDLVRDDDAAWVADDLLCLRVDATWRCGAPTQLGAGYPDVTRVHAPVRDARGLAIPIDVSRCDGGSELSECTYELMLLAIEGPSWTVAASLPVGASVDAHLRERDEDDAGVRVVGESHEYRRRLTVETPRCVRVDDMIRSAETYDLHFRDGRPDQQRRRPAAPSRDLGPRPAELPRRATRIDPYATPADLRGTWQLRDDRWLAVDRCDP